MAGRHHHAPARRRRAPARLPRPGRHAAARAGRGARAAAGAARRAPGRVPRAARHRPALAAPGPARPRLGRRSSPAPGRGRPTTVASPAPTPPTRCAPAIVVAATRIHKAHKRLVRDGRTIDDYSPAVALHDLRKDAKRLRYLLECFGSLFPAVDVATAVKPLKALQDTLGTFQDTEVQAHALADMAEQLVDRGAAGRHPAGHGCGDRARAPPGAPRPATSSPPASAPSTATASTSAYERLSEDAEAAVVKVLATYNIKGGVGKTATAVNLAYEAASRGNRVLVWDLDPQGAATFYFRIRPKVKGGGKALVSGPPRPRRGHQGERLRQPRRGAGRLLDAEPRPAARGLEEAARHAAPGAAQRAEGLRPRLPRLPAEHLAGVGERVPGRRRAARARSSRRRCRSAPSSSSTASSRRTPRS